MKLRLLIAICVLLISPLFARAGQLAYTCEISHVYNLEDNGSLKSTPNWEKQFKGSKFSVSRISGKIIGEVVTTVVSNSTKVINKGNEDYFFTSIAYFDGQAQLIEVQEFKKGEKKPFVAMSLGGAGIVTGVCK